MAAVKNENQNNVFHRASEKWERNLAKRTERQVQIMDFRLNLNRIQANPSKEKYTTPKRKLYTQSAINDPIEIVSAINGK